MHLHGGTGRHNGQVTRLIVDHWMVASSIHKDSSAGIESLLFHLLTLNLP
jgi:hypothetical protein